MRRAFVCGVVGLFGCTPELPSTDSGVAFTPTAGEDDDDDDDDGGGSEPSCDAPADDDMVLGGHIDLPGSVRRLAAHGSSALGCGDGFVALIGSDGNIDGQLPLDAPCVGLASVDDATAVAVTNDGVVHMLATSDGLSAGEQTTVSGATGVASLNAQVYVSAGASGVLVLDADDLSEVDTLAVSDARDVATDGEFIVVAAGSSGLEVFDDEGSSTGTLATPSPALGVRAGDGEAIVLRGAQGWDWVDLASGPELLTSTTTEGVVIDALLVSGNAFIVEGHSLLRFERDSDGARRISSEHRLDHAQIDGAWIRAISPIGDGYALGDDAGLANLQLRAPAPVPDVAIDAPSLQLFGDAGESVEGLFIVRNAGTADLLIRDVQIDGPFEVSLDNATLEESDRCDGQYVLPAGDSTSLSLLFDTGDGAPVSGTLSLETNDADQPTLEVQIDGNPAGPSVGATAADFTGLTLDGQPFRLADHTGKVVFLKLFDFGCSTCSEEFPIIETDVRPNYTSEDLVIVGVNKGHRTAYADSLADDAGLSFPVVLDLDSQAFRRYRVPNKVFPLHVVVDRDGTIALVSTEPGLAEVEATLASLLP